MGTMIRAFWQFTCFHVFTLFLVMFLPTESSEVQYKTKAASEKHHDLSCYRCDTMIDGEGCLDLHGNSTSMHMKCSREQKKCQVRRISMSTSTDEITGKPKLWLLQRNCSETCEPGCIVIGERTKLHSCITCCDGHSFCNADSSGHFEMISSFLVLVIKMNVLKVSAGVIKFIGR